MITDTERIDWIEGLAYSTGVEAAEICRHLERDADGSGGMIGGVNWPERDSKKSFRTIIDEAMREDHLSEFPSQFKRPHKRERRMVDAERRKGMHWKLRAQVVLRTSGLCARCKQPALEAAEVDHIIPISKGGKSVAENMQLLCASCHRIKTNQEMLA